MMSRFEIKPVRPFWKGYKPKLRFDIRNLMPVSLPQGQRFETLRDAEHEKQQRIQELLKGGRSDRDLADILEWHHEEGPEALACDPVDMREFRIWSSSEHLRLLHRFEDAWCLHPCFPQDTVPFGRLSQVNIPRVDHRLRKQISRKLGPNVLALGGIEVHADYESRSWLVHAHITVANCTKAGLRAFRDCYPRSEDGERLLKRSDLKDRAEQVSYQNKFLDIRRPFAQTGPKRPRGFRLYTKQHNEHMRFLAAHSPTDFHFLVNARRKNSTRLKLNPRVRNNLVVNDEQPAKA